MAGRTLTPQDACSLMTLLVKEATGQDASISKVDSSNFVSVGESVLASGVENTLNALSIVLGRTFMSVRPYTAKLLIMNAINTNLYSSRMRKVSFYARDPKNSGDWNTNAFTNLADGFTNGQNPDAQGDAQSTKSMWEQNAPVPLELNFGGQSVWEDSTTIYEYQLKVAFRSPEDFAAFVNGIMTEKANDIESQKEAFNRMTLLNYIGGVYDLTASMPGSVVNLTKAYNDKFGTSYTTAELQTTYLDSFLKFFVSEFKIASDLMTERSELYHWTPTKAGYTLLRHTPKERQRAILYGPLFTEAKAWVMPEIFNPSYLDLGQAEMVNYWQNINDGMSIDVTPAIPDVSDPSEQTAGSEVTTKVVGILYDVDAMMVDYQLETSAVTPLEARKHYRNMWWSFSKNAINDFTENCIIFVMEDPAA